MKTMDIDYEVSGRTYRGYLAYDDETAGKRPGVVVVHEAWGLGAHAKSRAEMLAGLGYVAFAADMYGDRLQVSELPEAMKLIGALVADATEYRARILGAVETLAAQEFVDGGRIGAIGFCFGGTTVLELARSGADVKGVVSFHGGLKPAKAAEPGGVKASVLVCTGADDPMIPPEQVTGFEAEMRAAGADWQVISYGNTVHSFTNPHADGSVSPAIMYNSSTDKRSWAAMKAFFDEVFA